LPQYERPRIMRGLSSFQRQRIESERRRPMRAHRPCAVECVFGLEPADADEVLGQTLGLSARPADLLGVEFMSGPGKWKQAGARLRHAPRRDGICCRLVRTVKRDAIVRCDNLQRALAFAISVDSFVDDMRIDDWTRRFKRSDPVPQALVCEQREVVGGVVRNNGYVLCEEGT